MCDLCDKIWSNLDAYKEQFGCHWDEANSIIMVGDKPYLYVPCDDYYYSRCVEEANYCPKCGRKLI
jgi:hypothetical protein